MKQSRICGILAAGLLAAAAPLSIAQASAVGIFCDGRPVHYDKIVFTVQRDLAAQAQPPVPAGTELDIKVIDVVGEVADLKGKVLAALNAPDTQNNRGAINIIDVEYAIVCEDGGVP